MSAPVDRILRPLATAAFALLKRRARSRPGVHAVTLTPERRIILVKLRYAPGWRLPGGGRHEGEDPTEAALLELTEEIGMSGHGAVERVQSGGDPLLIVRDVRYRQRRWSWEVEAVREAPLDALPPDLSPISARWLASLRSRI
jgi:8-oxo-dGTP pyrophosphatase MutT (NUDIX family)